jgi:glutamine synthetase
MVKELNNSEEIQIPTPQGKISLETLRLLSNDKQITTVLVVFTDMYGRLMGKRLTPDFFFDKYNSGIGACNYLLATDIEMNPIKSIKSFSWDLGYGDFLLMPDLNTLRIADWLDSSAIVICDVIDEKTKKPIETAPRTLLKRQITKAKALGFTAKAASELEYYTFDQSYKEANENDYQGLTASSWYSKDYNILQGSREEPLTAAVREHLERSGIPVENSKGETGIGQHELNIRYSDILEMADRHCLFKQCLKEVADQMGLSVSFMAKYKTEQAGSSCHLHLSLWKEGKNAFIGNRSLAGMKCSETFRHFLGGWMKLSPELMPFYAPTVNSYKRFQVESWAPVSLAWSIDNRTTGFRVIGHKEDLRIECRFPGADVNPYLAFTAALASGIAGIEQKIDPPKAFSGNAYKEKNLISLPSNLHDATERFNNSVFAQKCFGRAVVADYTCFYQNEWQSFQQAVTDWELTRYFERI